jgi:hypothetical protein
VGRAAHGVGAVQAQREVGAYASRRATASFAGLHTPIRLRESLPVEILSERRSKFGLS